MTVIDRRYFLGRFLNRVLNPSSMDPGRLGVACSIGTSEASARKALAAVRHAGFHKIQLQIPWAKVDETFLKKVPGWLHDEGIKTEVLGAYVNCCMPENVWMDCRRMDFERAIHFSTLIGTDRLVAWTGGYGSNLMEADPRNFSPAAEAALCRFIESNAKYLEKTKRLLALETYITLTCPDAPSLAKVLKKMPEYIGAVLDPPNLTPLHRFSQRDAALQEMFQLLRDRITVVHLKDFRLAPDRNSYLLPGPLQGEMNYPLFAREIKKLPPQIPLIAEHLVPEKYAEARQRLLSVF